MIGRIRASARRGGAPRGRSYEATAAAGAAAGAWRGRRGPTPTSSAGQPAQACSLGVGVNCPARMRPIASESSASSTRLGALEGRGDDGVGPLEELVDDLHFLGAGAETGERIDESLQAVLLLDDLLRQRLLEDVRLVVDDDGAAFLLVQDVEAPVEQHAVVLERERPLHACPGKLGDQRPTSESQYAATRPRMRSSSSSVTAGYQART